MSKGVWSFLIEEIQDSRVNAKSNKQITVPSASESPDSEAPTLKLD